MWCQSRQELAYYSLYFGFTFFGPGYFKFGIKNDKSMSEWNEIFNKCKEIKSIKSMHGLHRGELLQFNRFVGCFQNPLISHSWYGKAFDGYNATAAALIFQSWFFIPTCFKYNYVPVGFATLKKYEFEGKVSVGMKYRLSPIIDHMREYIDEDGNECYLGVMVICGYKLMYFKLFK